MSIYTFFLPTLPCPVHAPSKVSTRISLKGVVTAAWIVITLSKCRPLSAVLILENKKKSAETSSDCRIAVALCFAQLTDM